MELAPVEGQFGRLQTPYAPENLLSNALISTWYQPSRGHSPALAPAEAAYAAAKLYFSSHLTNDDCKRIWLADKTTMQDVVAAVEAAKASYEARSRKGNKARQYLTSFSSRVMYYGGIMDTLSQQHPEYVALAWGAMKFLFVGLLNHEEILASIAKTLSRIADVLPRVELDVNLYSHPLILISVSKLYAHIINFIQFAVRWYQKGKIAHSLASILKPFQIKGKEMVEEIIECSRNVDKLAMSASRAETRELHFKIIELTRLATAVEENHTLNQRMSVDMRNVRDNHIAQILALPNVKNLPSASQTLAFQIAMRNHYRIRHRLSQEYCHWVPSLQQWASEKLCLLLIQGRKNPKSPRFLATSVVEEVSKSPIPVIWALAKSRLHSTDLPLADVLRMLTVQALQIARSSPTEAVLISQSEFENTDTDEEWLDLLKRALSGLKQVYVLIDTDMLNCRAIGSDQQRVVESMAKLMRKSHSDGLELKIILCAHRFVEAVVKSADMADEFRHLDLSSRAEGHGKLNRRKSAIRGLQEQSPRYRGRRGKPRESDVSIKCLFTRNDCEIEHISP